MEEVSAFAEYKKSKQKRKIKKKHRQKKNNSESGKSTSDVPNGSFEADNQTFTLSKILPKSESTNGVQAKLVSKKRRHDDIEEDLWNEFVTDMGQLRKTKKRKKGGPQNMLFTEFVENSAGYNKNVFLKSMKKKPIFGKISDNTVVVHPMTSTPMEEITKNLEPNREVSKIDLHLSQTSLIKEYKAPKMPFNSVEEGRKMLQWIISPSPVEKFMSEYWERKPLYIPRTNRNYFEGICSKDDIDCALRHFPLYFGKNVDITAYEDKVRTTENPTGRARPSIVWDLFNKGRSVRLLNPQSFIPNIRIIVSHLQEYFRCFVGVNSYLTPAGTQGFAPHFDDIEAFVLQLEGEKTWKVYPPRNENETLPRLSSPNFTDDTIGEPILEVTLKPGDLLYFPRGFIHQAKSVPDQYSLHITLSAYQRNTWLDFFEKALPVALQLAADESLPHRRGLPLTFLDNFGIVNSEKSSHERMEFLNEAKKLFQKLVDFIPWDATADQLAKEMIHSAMPPLHSNFPEEQKWEEILLSDEALSYKVKLISKHCLRLVSEEDELIVYYTTDNSLEYHGEDPQEFLIDPESAPALEVLIDSYPNFQKIRRLPNYADYPAVSNLLVELANRRLVVVKKIKKASN